MMDLLGLALAWSIQLLDQDPDRPQIALPQCEALLANNIFSPAKVVRRALPARRTEIRSEPSKPKAKPPIVTGFILDPATTVYKVIIEDRNSDEKLKHFKGPKFLAAGDEILGFKVESVSEQAVVLRKGEETEELKVGEPLPENGAIEPAATAATVETAPPPDDLQKVLEELKRRRNKTRREEDFRRPE